MADQLSEGLKKVKKWNKNSTTENWFKLFPTSGTERAFSQNIRPYLRGDIVLGPNNRSENPALQTNI